MERSRRLNLKVVNSTNLFALENLNSFEDNQVVISDIQTNGRGRFNRPWYGNNSGNVYMSIVFRPKNSSFPYANLTQYMSVVLCKVLKNHYGIEANIKWPNDILIDGAKIAGILCETSNKNNQIEALVLGLGVNLNFTSEMLQSIDQKATSLNILLDKQIDRDEFIDYLLDEFYFNYEQFVQQGFEFILDEYTSKCDFLGKEIKVSSLNSDEDYSADSISNDGTLNVLDKNNNQIKITTGDLIIQTDLEAITRYR